jgi:hypothetical protein
VEDDGAPPQSGGTPTPLPVTGRSLTSTLLRARALALNANQSGRTDDNGRRGRPSSL